MLNYDEEILVSKDGRTARTMTMFEAAILLRSSVLVVVEVKPGDWAVLGVCC